MVLREMEADRVRPGLVQDDESDLDLVVLDEGLADAEALGLQEGVSHGAADQDVIGLAEQALDDLDLVRDLGPAEDGHVGLHRRVDGPFQVVDLLLHEVAGGLDGNEIGDADDRGVGPVARAEGVVDEDVDVLGQLAGEPGVVLLLLLVEPDVLEQEHFAVAQEPLEPPDLVADDIGSHDDLVRNELGQPLRGRLEAHRRVDLALGPSEVGGDDEPGAVFEEPGDGRQGRPDAGVVADLALVVEGDVEVDAEENELAFDVEVGYEVHPRLTWPRTWPGRRDGRSSPTRCRTRR